MRKFVGLSAIAALAAAPAVQDGAEVQAFSVAAGKGGRSSGRHAHGWNWVLRTKGKHPRQPQVDLHDNRRKTDSRNSRLTLRREIGNRHNPAAAHSSFGTGILPLLWMASSTGARPQHVSTLVGDTDSSSLGLKTVVSTDWSGNVVPLTLSQEEDTTKSRSSGANRRRKKRGNKKPDVHWEERYKEDLERVEAYWREQEEDKFKKLNELLTEAKAEWQKANENKQSAASSKQTALTQLSDALSAQKEVVESQLDRTDINNFDDGDDILEKLRNAAARNENALQWVWTAVSAGKHAVKTKSHSEAVISETVGRMAGHIQRLRDWLSYARDGWSHAFHEKQSAIREFNLAVERRDDALSKHESLMNPSFYTLVRNLGHATVEQKISATQEVYDARNFFEKAQGAKEKAKDHADEKQEILAISVLKTYEEVNDLKTALAVKIQIAEEAESAELDPAWQETAQLAGEVDALLQEATKLVESTRQSISSYDVPWLRGPQDKSQSDTAQDEGTQGQDSVGVFSNALSFLHRNGVIIR